MNLPDELDVLHAVFLQRSLDLVRSVHRSEKISIERQTDRLSGCRALLPHIKGSTGVVRSAQTSYLSARASPSLSQAAAGLFPHSLHVKETHAYSYGLLTKLLLALSGPCREGTERLNDPALRATLSSLSSSMCEEIYRRSPWQALPFSSTYLGFNHSCCSGGNYANNKIISSAAMTVSQVLKSDAQE